MERGRACQIPRRQPIRGEHLIHMGRSNTVYYLQLVKVCVRARAHLYYFYREGKVVEKVEYRDEGKMFLTFCDYGSAAEKDIKSAGNHFRF